MLSVGPAFGSFRWATMECSSQPASLGLEHPLLSSCFPQEHQGLEVIMVQAHALQQLLEAQAHSSLVSGLKALHLFNLIVFL